MSTQKTIEWKGDETWKNKTKSERRKIVEGAFDEFFAENEHLKLVNTSDDIICPNEYDINSDDEEVWLVQLPKTIKPSKMENIFVPSHKGQMKLEGNKKYECVVEKYKTTPTTMAMFVKGEKKLIKLQPKRKMIIRKRLESPEPIDIEIDVIEDVPQPADLKVRHPLFGFDFEDIISLPASVQRKLEEAKQQRARVVNVKQEANVKKEKEVNGAKRKRKSIKTEVISPEKSSSPKKMKIKQEAEDMSWMDNI